MLIALTSRRGSEGQREGLIKQLSEVGVDPSVFSELKFFPEELRAEIEERDDAEFLTFFRQQFELTEARFGEFAKSLKGDFRKIPGGIGRAALAKAYMALESMKRHGVEGRNAIIVGNSIEMDLGAARLLGIPHAPANKQLKYSSAVAMDLPGAKRRISRDKAIERRAKAVEQSKRKWIAKNATTSFGKPYQWHKQKAIRNFLGNSVWRGIVPAGKKFAARKPRI